MRVLLIHSNYKYATGEETYVTSLNKLLQENGHKVYLYSKNNKEIVTFFDKLRVAVGLFWNLRTDKELRRIVHEFHPDVAHIHNLYPEIGATAYLTLAKLGVPILQTIHNYRFMCPKGHLFRKSSVCELCVGLRLPFWAVLYGCYHESPAASLFYSLSYFYHRVIAKSFNNIQLYVFPSEFTKKYYLRHLHIPDNKTVYLPNFVDLGLSKAPRREKDYYIYAGRLSEEKGILQVLERFRQNPENRLKIVGDGPLAKIVQSYAKYPNIEIMGHLPREQLLPLLRDAKALIFNSQWYEVLPYVLLEAISLGTPIQSPRIEDIEKIRRNPVSLEPQYHLKKIISHYRSII